MNAILGALITMFFTLSAGLGEDVEPAVAPLLAKQREEIAKLMDKTEAATGFARDAYLVALDKIEHRRRDSYRIGTPGGEIERPKF